MNMLRFDDRTAIVTGAGGNPSLGRAHALLLGSRGANVVVNDIGTDPEARHYPGAASAEAVAEEIRRAGGRAVASTASVTSAAGADAIVQCALEAFGKVDILVNNAGVSIGAPFDEISERDIQRHIDINLMGSIWCARAAWPHMKAQGYGRIVNITSSSMTGFANQVAYAASKGGAWSLTRSLAAEGEAHGIKVNAVSPGGYTRLVISTCEDDSPLLANARENLPPELSSPAVAFLAHETCPVTGECIDSVGGEVQRCFISRTGGFSDRDHTIETIARRWNEVMDPAAANAVGLAAMDTSGWGLRSYEPADD
ncbi:SDR family NAD(P)-dependent oxidoreductase [Novosphingobium album (ex Liu et al. 2023)]|uniref:SDR family NAD(P)-dependent oxidoreductase n=1 Tax=Novosphingobium album (ex Liu et al. 2023) TaxID=3031130 RepID=A0ABT5WT64_9SPHN|nr:SDR family NAD(P)-dependent oxidoreductase [Novosphingobium album (ex Liu et al. 2023)]MDE8653174.1 SDR family NAD(P)-dependent oxidoreductase [Novosphingobium album (ex Liu et al. 2023)]